ncbi:hypothetical protein FIU91_17715 [Roseivivax sp. THAF30]|nr:hypothetical protein FIU91_17715 [Roseivivax sp. THAF30]
MSCDGTLYTKITILSKIVIYIRFKIGLFEHPIPKNLREHRTK